MIFVHALLIATQIVSPSHDSVRNSPALDSLVATVSRVNRRVPADLAGYTAKIESEVAVIATTPPNQVDAGLSGTETAAEIEQVLSLGVWDRSGRFQQTVVGYRARQLGPMISALTFIPRPWTAPTLYGNRLSLIFGGPPSFAASERARQQMMAVHPFAEDRDQYYRFSGGDTVASVHVGPRILRIVSIHVEPLAKHPRATVFAGDVLVDGGTGAIIRMRGRITLTAQESEPFLVRVIRSATRAQGVAYIDFENSLYEGRFWLPQTQRLEYQVTTGLSESKATIRVESVWRDVKPESRTVDSAGVDSATVSDTIGSARYSLRFASADSTAHWSDWDHELGAMTAATTSDDFNDVAPPDLRPGESPRLRWQARKFSDLVRFNRVEGLYLGESALLDFGHAAPGLSLRMSGGVATYAKTLKGALEAADIRGPWVFSGTAARQLVSTNDFSQVFRDQSGDPGSSLFGQENYDWVDRRIAALGVSRELRRLRASSVRVQVAEGRDDGFAREMTRGPLGGTYRPNRPVTPGRYVSTRIQLDLGSNVVSNPLVSGVGAAMAYTRGDGQLSWQRAQIQALGQRMFGRFDLAARVDAAVVRGSDPPIQQLLEVGGTEGLPGYDYKAFTGDQATIVRGTVAYRLPVWESPIRIRQFILPAVAPRVQVGLFGGRVSATSATTRILDQLGWVTTDGWRGSLDVRVLFFGGAVGIGVSRPIDRQRPWKLSVGDGR